MYTSSIIESTPKKDKKTLVEFGIGTTEEHDKGTLQSDLTIGPSRRKEAD